MSGRYVVQLGVLVWSAAVLALTLGRVAPDRPPRRSYDLPIEAAVAMLRSTTQLYGNRIGFLSMPTMEAVVWRRLIAAPEAEEHLQELFYTGSYAAQFYALIGLHAINARSFTYYAAVLDRAEATILVSRDYGSEHFSPQALVWEIQMGIWWREFLDDPVPLAPGPWMAAGALVDW